MLTVPTDVSRLEAVQALHDAAYARFGEVAVLMNNAGTGRAGPLGVHRRWRRVLEVNLWGVINGVQPSPRRCWRKDGMRHCQYRIEAGDHLPAGRHRL